MIKIAMIGAGSVVFSKNLTGDILGHREFHDATFSYMDIDAERLEVGAALCRKTASALGANPIIHATQDRRAALDGADFVINMVQIGGFDSTLIDFEIPRKYGLNFTIADTTGPGGMFRALRTFPFLQSLCREMESLCPNAILLNYSNPMSMNMQAVSRTSCIRAVGLCHSVQGTLRELMGYIGEDPEGIAFVCAGINHMAFYLRLEKEGEDLYPRLFEAMNTRPDVYNSNKVRFELMRRLGYFVTESSEHNAEYSPWFIPRGRETIAKFSVPIDEYLRRCDAIIDEFARLKALSQSDQPIEVRRSSEYGSTIIKAMTSGYPAVVYGNMPNRGAISNLPCDAIVEAPTLVDRAGLRFTMVGAIPPQLVGYMQPHVIQHELFIRAAMEGRRDHVYQAALLDPLTAATLSPDRIVEMCDEMIAAHGFASQGGVLPDLDAKRTLVPSCGKPFSAADPRELRAAWNQMQRRRDAEHIIDWRVIGPFKSRELGRVSLSDPTPIEPGAARDFEGAVDLNAVYPGSHGNPLKWRTARAGKHGFVDLAATLGAAEWAIAYGYAECKSDRDRDAILRCGSDDGVRIWLNGKLIHEHEIGRPYQAGEDEIVAHLQLGMNRLLLKIENRTGDWGFGLAVPECSD